MTHIPWRIADPNYVSIILSKFIIRGERSSLTFSYFDDSQRIGFGVGWHVYILLLGETYLAYLGVCWQSQQCWRSLIGCRLNKPRLAVLRYKSVVVAPRFVSLTVPGTSLSILFLYVYTYIYIYIYMSLILLNSRSNPLLLKKMKKRLSIVHCYIADSSTEEKPINGLRIRCHRKLIDRDNV